MGGRIVVKTASGQVLRLGSRSQIAFLPDAGAEPGPTRVRLDNGWLWVAVAPNSPRATQIEVRAGPVVVAVRGAGVGLRRGVDGSVLVQVHHGNAVCAAPERQWERVLTGPQQLLVPPAGMPDPPTKLTVDTLEVTWVKWNTDQDVAGGFGGVKPAP
jgi:ferric-dicitrate binding protein FerR (iron transport regulator)